MTAPKSPFRIFNAPGLVADFRARRVTKRVHLAYLLGDIALLTLGGVSMSLRMPPGDDGLGWPLTLTLITTIVALGTFWCYRNNSRGDNTDFLDRFIAVNFVVSMRFLVAYIGVMAVLALLSVSLAGTAFTSAVSALGASATAYFVIMALVFGLYYYFAAKYIGQIAEAVAPEKGVHQNT